MIVHNKPSVSDPGYCWVMIDQDGEVSLYRQTRIDVNGTEFGAIDHYRLKVNGKWIRKTFFGESAWCDVERYAEDAFRSVVTT